MKKHILLLSSLAIIFSIVIGFVGIVYKDTTAYQDLAEKHMENVLSLADKDISSHIEDTMTKPVMVSKTMANDEFLKNWLMQEPENVKNDTYLKQLYSYLKTYQEEYDYTTVFCVSSQTGNYYYQDGLNKTLSKEDTHDIWYYNFIGSGHEYDLEVDTNQTKNDYITVFVNFRIENNNGELLGVIGVGLQVDALENTVCSYEKDYGLSVYIINTLGARTSFTGDTNIFIREDDLPKLTGITNRIKLNKSEAPILQWYSSDGERKCLITKYNETLGWHFILEMDTSSISSVFQDRVKSNILFMLVATIACTMVSTTVFINYNQRVITIENTDELTGLPNRKQFAKLYLRFIRKYKNRRKTLVMFDIDHFKGINDTYGHIFGNEILSIVGEELRKAISGDGIAARWGGDEFLSILTVEPDQAKQIMERLMDSLKNQEKGESYNVTVSVGIIEVDKKLGMEQLIKKADEALYQSKENGRDQISIVHQQE
ncbi:diguanylate cyclase [Oscillibacter sp.]|uniref:sensor domain-containing diguanylate cyclase n=1 Tax=Oscillibacter sp. TaxID=1945593 RepID=UPI003394D54B